MATDPVAAFRRQLQALRAQLAGMAHSVDAMLEQLPDERSDPRAHAGAETFDDNDGDASIVMHTTNHTRGRVAGRKRTAAR